MDRCRCRGPCCEAHHCRLATCNGPMTPAAQTDDGFDTFGGYSNVLLVKDDLVLHIPASLPVKAAAPILCAGMTTWSPMKHRGVTAGDTAGVVGLGGRGHMAVKLAVALGVAMTVFTTSTRS